MNIARVKRAVDVTKVNVTVTDSDANTSKTDLEDLTPFTNYVIEVSASAN